MNETVKNNLQGRNTLTLTAERRVFICFQEFCLHGIQFLEITNFMSAFKLMFFYDVSLVSQCYVCLVSVSVKAIFQKYCRLELVFSSSYCLQAWSISLVF